MEDWDVRPTLSARLTPLVASSRAVGDMWMVGAAGGVGVRYSGMKGEEQS